jgi:thioredoxin reductase (NADPH)
LEGVGVKVNKSNMKIICNDSDQTSVEGIYAVGDCVEGRLELTPAAIMCGRRLVRRLYDGASEKMDYSNVPTTIFTPLEYGSVGLSESAAIKK